MDARWSPVKKNIPMTLLILILLGVFGYSAWQVGSYLVDSVKQKNTYDQLAAMVEQAQATATESPADATPPSPEVPGESVPETEPLPDMLPEYEALFALNDDMVGWLKIDGTPVNYPVMQTPTVPEYYLYRNFYFERSDRGCLFTEEDCDVNAPSDNVVIYGHCMKDGSMFAALANFTSKSYWESHPTFRFDTLYEHRSYRIFAVFKTSATPGEGFAYHTFQDAAREVEFDAFVSQCKGLSLYDTGITPAYGDKRLCLSTCEYTQANGRLVVVAVLEPDATA